VVFTVKPTVTLTDALFKAGLPEVRCCGCGDMINRRADRMMLRASWRETTESLCPTCWGTVCAWASRFALQQQELEL
jgi:hypothetical protein